MRVSLQSRARTRLKDRGHNPAMCVPASSRRRGMTVIELMVVMAVSAVILGLTLSVYNHSVRLSRQTACLSNLRQLALALNTYYTEHRQLPPDDVPGRFDESLLPVVGDSAVFHCPADPNEGASSYGPYYVHRREMNPRDFMVGCPRHAGGRAATILFGSAGAEGGRLGEITHDGQEVKVGDRVAGGILRFADGSVASITADLSVDIVTSFQRGDGSYYTVLRIPLGEEGTIGLEVNPKSRLEVITPAAIAGSEGTRFYVETLPCENGKRSTVVYVKRGKVRMTSRGRRPAQQLVMPWEAYRGERPSGKIKKHTWPEDKDLPWLPDGEKHYDPAG